MIHAFAPGADGRRLLGTAGGVPVHPRQVRSRSAAGDVGAAGKWKRDVYGAANELRLSEQDMKRVEELL